MTLAGTYTVYGTVYDIDNNPITDATVNIIDVSDRQGTASYTTGVSGYYQINIQDVASDGDIILVEVELSSGYVYGECFTLNLYDTPKNIDMTIKEYKYLEISSDNYTIKLRFCPIEEPNRSIRRNTDVLNLWSEDDIGVIDKDLNSEPLFIRGIEYAESEKEVCYVAKKFEDIWYIQDNNEEITINDFNDCFNSVYIIKNFKVQSIRRSGNAYMWELQLERVRDIDD